MATVTLDPLWLQGKNEIKTYEKSLSLKGIADSKK